MYVRAYLHVITWQKDHTLRQLSIAGSLQIELVSLHYNVDCGGLSIFGWVAMQVMPERWAARFASKSGPFMFGTWCLGANCFSAGLTS